MKQVVRWRVLKTSALLLALVGCTVAELNPEVNFLRWSVEHGDIDLALTEGKLILNQGCLHVQSNPDDPGYAVIWPFEFGVSVQDGKVAVLGEEGQVLAQVGDTLEVGGGEFHLLPEELEQYVLGTSRCVDTYQREGYDVYWRAGHHVEVITP